MKIYNLKDMIKGWIIGDFIPSVLQNKEFEVAIKKYKTGESESKHYHKIATEITVIASGKVEMNGILYKEDDIIIVEPGESTDFQALEDTITVVVKLPSIVNDKYLDKVKNNEF